MVRARKKHLTKGIFCLESPRWYSAKDKTSVVPILEMLSKLYGEEVPYLYATIATPSELEHHLKAYFMRQFKTHPILYIATHGAAEPQPMISMPGGDMSMESLGDVMKQKCEHRIIFFGAAR